MFRWILILALSWAASLLAQLAPDGNPNPPKFPSFLATLNDLHVYRNVTGTSALSTTLSAGINDSTLTIPVVDESGFQVGLIAVIESERVAICSVSASTITVCTGGRGFQGTTAAAHSISVAVTAKTAAVTRISSSITAATLSIPVQDGEVLLADSVITVETERIKICTIAADTLTVCAGGRGFDGSLASSHPALSQVRNFIVSSSLNQAWAEIIAIEAELGATGSSNFYDLRTDENIGLHFMDIQEISVPANPAASTRRLFTDTATGELSVRTSAGATVSLEGIGGVPAHASTHQDSGSDEVATATPGANAILKAEADGDINAGWISLDSAYTWSGNHLFKNLNAIRFCDQFASLQLCHDDLPAGGGTIFVPEGIYNLTSPLNWTKSNLKVIGAGMGATIIQRGTFGADNNTVIMTGTNVIVRDMTFDGNGISTVNSILVLNGTNMVADSIEVKDNEAIAINAVGTGVRIINSRIIGLASATNGSIGIWFDSATTNGLTIANNRIEGHRLNGIFGKGNNIVVEGNHFRNNHCQTSPTGGGQVVLSGLVSDENLVFANNTVETGCAGATSGLEINANNLTIIGNTIDAQQLNGIVLQAGSNVLVVGNVVKNSGVDGIVVAAGVSGFQIVGNKFYDDQGTPTQDWGINVVAGASDNYIIADNDLRGNVNGGLTDNGEGATKIVKDNLPRTRNVHWVEEWMGGTTATGDGGDHGWLTNGIFTRISALNHPGIRRVQTTTTINTYRVAHTGAGGGGSTFTPGDKFDFTVIVMPQVFVTAQTQIRVGVAGTPTSNPSATGIYFEKLFADTNYFAVTRTASIETRNDTGVAVADATWARLRARRKNATNICFSVDGGTEICHTTDIPTVDMNFLLSIENGDATDRFLAFDYVSLDIEVTR